MARQGLHPLVLGATAAAVLSALGTRAARMDRDGHPADVARVAPAPVAIGVDGLTAPCASGTLPEGPVCLRIPTSESAEADVVRDPHEAAPTRGESAQRDRELVPRRPDRPADPAAYVFPVEGTRVLQGAESPPRPGGRVAVRPGEIVRALALTGQAGPARVVVVGDTPVLLVTAHEIEASGKKSTVLLLHEGLDHVAKGVVPGAEIAAGGELGAARREIDGGLLSIYVEAREVRDEPSGARRTLADLQKLDARRISDLAVSVPTDARNVLPLR